MEGRRGRGSKHGWLACWVRQTARTEVERRRRRRFSIMTSKEKENSRARVAGSGHGHGSLSDDGRWSAMILLHNLGFPQKRKYRHARLPCLESKCLKTLRRELHLLQGFLAISCS